MAPKKKPKGKKSKGKDGAVRPSGAAPFVSEKEQRLQKELDILSEHIVTYSQRLRHFQSENEYLDKEAQQVREASKVYLSYLTRRTVRCQNAIVSLNDQNRSDLSQIQKQKAEVAAQCAEREREVRRQLMELENKLFLLNREVAELQPWQNLQLRHLTQIRELEKELLITKIQHAEQMHRVKSRFLHQAAEYEMNAQQKVQILAKLAEEAAVRSLIQHTKQVKADNWSLQNELLGLIKQAQTLKAFLRHLQEQQHRLFQEHQCRQDLARRRSWLQQHHRGSRQVITPGSSFRCTPASQGQACLAFLSRGQPADHAGIRALLKQLPARKDGCASLSRAQHLKASLPRALSWPLQPATGAFPRRGARKQHNRASEAELTPHRQGHSYLWGSQVSAI